MFFSVCLGSAALTSWPYRGAAEGMRWVVQETGALANFSALTTPGQEFNAFPLQKNSPLSFPPSLSAALRHHRPPAWPGEPPLACLLLQKRLKPKVMPLKSCCFVSLGCVFPPRRLDVKHRKVPHGNTNKKDIYVMEVIVLLFKKKYLDYSKKKRCPFF